ncbi:MAG: PAS domain S-box protein [Firmicutes bacterium]|nr:PAS domain S-box protein [Bacillota bacterium]
MIDESQKPSLLHIDDSKDFLDIFSMTFRKQFSLTSVLSGSEALEKLRNNSYDLIISDYEMPMMDGLTLLKSVRQLYPDIPIVFLTGQGNERVAREAFINGASDYFTKDLYGFASKEKLSNSINTLLEKRKAEIALQRTHERLGYIIKHDPNAIAVFDNFMNYVFVSDRFIKDYRLSSGDIIGKNHYEIFPEIPEEWKEIHRKVLSGMIISADEDILVRQDGTQDFIKWECRPWWETPDKIGGMIMYTEVITDRKKTEIKLRQSEELYRKLVNTSPDSICITDLQGNLLFGSLRAYEMLGYSIEDNVMGTSPIMMVIPEDREAAYINMMKIMSGEVIGSNEYRMYKKDGSLIYTEINTTPLFDDDGKINSLLSVIRDVTERKKIENKIVHLNKVLKAIRHVNQIIVKEKEPDKLIQEVCKTLIETRGYDFAWIFTLDSKGNPERSYEAGLSEEFHNIINNCEKGDILSCLRKITDVSDPVLSTQFSETCPTCPVRAIYRSNPGILAKIEHEDKLYGYISVSIPDIINIDEEETELFREVAGDVGYAIHNIKTAEEKKNTRIELRKERDMFRKYMDISGVMMLALDQKGNITLINSRGCEILGYRHEELMGKNWFDICIPDEIRESLRNTYLKTIKRESSNPNYFEDHGFHSNSIITRQGIIREISWHNSMLKNENGEIGGVVCSGLDITDINSLKEDSAKDRLLIDSLLEISPASIVVLNREGLITYANIQAEELLKVRKDSIVSLYYNAPEFKITDFDKNPYPNEKLPFNIVKNTQKPVFNVEHCIIGDDESVKYLSINAAPLFDGSGNWDGVLAVIQDISNQILVKKDIENLMEFYRTIIETTGTAIMVFGDDCIITHSNREMEKLSGFPLDEVINKKRWSDFVTGPDLVKMQEYHKLRGDHSDEAPRKYDFVFIDRHGTAKHVMINITLIPNTRMRVASLINITEQKRSEAMYKAMFDNTAMAMVLFEEDTTITLVNREFEKMTGYMKEEIEGIMSWTDLIAEEDLDRMFKYYQIRIITQDILPKSYSTKIVRKSGEIKHVDVSVAVILHTNQRIASIMDVTKIKKTENNFILSQKKLALSNKIANAFLTFSDDRTFNEALKIIIEVMRSETGLFGYIDENSMIVCPSVCGKIPEKLKNAINNETVDSLGENSIWRGAISDQKTIIINRKTELPEDRLIQEETLVINRAIVSPIIYGKRTIGLLAMINKETDYNYEDEETIESICNQIAPILYSRFENMAKEKEKEEAREQLLKINKELNDFAHVVSHDLKSPLNLMKAQIQAAGEDQELFGQLYPKMVKQADYLLSFIDNLLKLSRAGRIVEQKINISLRQLIQSSFEFLASNCRTCELNNQMPPLKLYADYQGMDQIFSNLIQNSIKFKDPGKEKLIITVSATEKNSDLVIVFEDNGIGIEETVIGKIFNSGFTTSKEMGTGFGLAIVRKVIEAHNGKIEAYSEGKGKGSRFVITIPVVEEEKTSDVT